jgi:hypothetical protein
MAIKYFDQSTKNIGSTEIYKLNFLAKLEILNSSIPVSVFYHLLNISSESLKHLTVTKCEIIGNIYSYQQVSDLHCSLLLTIFELPRLLSFDMRNIKMRHDTKLALGKFSTLSLPQLRQITLTDNYSITAEQVNLILENVKELSILETPICSDNTLELIGRKAISLREINAGGRELTEAGLLKLPVTLRSTIESLRITEANIIGNQLLDFLKDCPSLRYISINLRQYGPTDEFMKSISESCPRLEHVVIGGMNSYHERLSEQTNKLTDEGLTHFILTMKKLRLIVLEFAPLTEYQLEKVLRQVRTKGRIAPRVVQVVGRSEKDLKKHMIYYRNDSNCNLI